MRTTILKPSGFSLKAAADFYASFTPGSGMAAVATGRLTLAFRLDETFEAVAVALSEREDAIELEIAGTGDTGTVLTQVTRILGLDADGEAWRDVGRRDPVVGRVQREFEGFFTAAKSSPYDAATWGVIAPRLSIAAAAKIKTALARAHGDAVTMGGRTHHVFPSPRVVRDLCAIEGLPDEKVARLRGIADAALAGRLDPKRLRAMPESEALADLQALRGVGPWTASHIYFRGAALSDALPTIEPRVLRGWAHAAEIARPTVEDFVRAAEAWRPFRMWVTILFARHLARSGGWNGPGLAKEREEAIHRHRTQVRYPSASGKGRRRSEEARAVGGSR
jgi:DNA-3-methyladenine glycosylase II